MLTELNLKALGLQFNKFDDEELIQIYKELVKEFQFGYDIPTNTFNLVEISKNENIIFFKIVFKDSGKNSDFMIWAFNNNVLYNVLSQDDAIRENYMDMYNESIHYYDVSDIDSEGKKDELREFTINNLYDEDDDDFEDISLDDEEKDEIYDVFDESKDISVDREIDDYVIQCLDYVFNYIVFALSKEGVLRDKYTLKYIKKSDKYYYFCLAPKKPDVLSDDQLIWATDFRKLFKVDDELFSDCMDNATIVKLDYSLFSTKNKYSELFDETDSSSEKEDNANDKSLSSIMNKLDKVKEELSSVVKGQDAAIDRFVSGLFDILAFESNDNIKGSFLFIGPSGTGKTLLAKTIAKSIGMKSLIVNLSEYSDKDAVTRFRGFDKTFRNSTPGVVTSFINNNPDTVIIFDEVDKCHITVKNLLLQLYNDGYIFDPQLEKNVSFKNTILIFTTNAGKKLYLDNDKPLFTLSNKKIINALSQEKDSSDNQLFPTSLISRFASKGIIVFNNLEPYTLYEITKNSFEDKTKRFEKSNIGKIEYDDNIISALLYQLGGKSDGRNLVGLASKYMEDEIIEALRQLNEENVSKIKKIKFSIDIKNNEEYFSEKPSKALVFMDYTKFMELDKNIQGIDFYHASRIDNAKELLRKDIDFIIIDVMTNASGSYIYNDIEDIESEGRDLISYCSTFHNEIPIYVINEGRNNKEFETLFKIGVKGLINTKESFTDDLLLAKAKASMTKNCYKLSRANKVLQYRTRQKSYDDVIEIEMYNLKFVIDYNVEDDDFVMDFDRPTIKFDDVIGQDDAKETLKDFIKYLNNPIAYIENGVRPPRGILFYGPPGTGKTLLAKALAGESTVSFLQKNASDFVNKAPSEIENLFKKARKYAPAIIFLDEVDAIAKERMGYSTNESILNKLLSEIDGFNFDYKRPVLVIAATNYPIEKTAPNVVALDPAFVRRFDRKIKIGLPNKDERIKFINYYLEKHSINTISEECIKNIASRTMYYSPADLELLIEHAIRRAEFNPLTDEILSDTVDENKHGKSNILDLEEIKRTAIHESGHALVCYLCGIVPAYLTIISRGGYGGYMAYGENNNINTYTKQDLLDRIAISLAGRAAEVIEYGDKLGVTTGPSSDLFNATNIAKSIIAEYGMNDSLVSLKALGANENINIINDINKILNQEFDRAKKLIINNKAKYNELVDKLLDKNSLTEAEITKILE